jgi:hypothetical protein
MTTEVAGINRKDQIFCPIIFSGLLVGIYGSCVTIFADRVLLIILVAAILPMTSCLVLNAPFAASQPELPRREFLTDCVSLHSQATNTL